jgi:hypothetical protein
LTAFGFVWVGLMFLLAGLNVMLVVAADPLTWARFHLFVPPISMIGLLLDPERLHAYGWNEVPVLNPPAASRSRRH